jgi:hypothetical protein
MGALPVGLPEKLRGHPIPARERAMERRRLGIPHEIGDLANRERLLPQEAMAAFRAIENGVSLVRPGISSAIDPWGRVLGVADSFAQGDGTLTAQVPVRGVRTLYPAIGDLFAWLCVAGLVVGLGAAVRGPRTRPAQAMIKIAH